MRFISSFSAENHLLLKQYLLDKTLLDRERKRFTCIFLSSIHRMKIDELSTLFSVSKNSISSWFDSYDSKGFAVLMDGNMAHKKSTLSHHSESVILSHIQQNPQNLDCAVASLAAQENIQTNSNILRTFLKKKVYLETSQKVFEKSAKSRGF